MGCWPSAGSPHWCADGGGQLASVNLDVKNPNGAEDLEHQPPEKLVEDILTKEQRIIEIMGEIKAVLKAS